MSNSKLVNCTILSPNHSGKRTQKITRITPHCVVGQTSAERIGEIFKKRSKNASCNYGIGLDGRVCLVVDECNRSWCSSNRDNDQRAVTIECASDAKSPYKMNAQVYNKLIELCADICKRNGFTKLIWIGDAKKALNYKPKTGECIITVHRWFANKSCPGEWLYKRLPDVAKTVTDMLNPAPTLDFTIQIGAYTSESNAKAMVTKARNKGFDGATYSLKDGYYKVVFEGFTSESNAAKFLADLKDNSLNGFIVKKDNKTIDEIAKEVIKGLWGNGADRKARLSAAGYNYADVQKRVNELI